MTPIPASQGALHSATLATQWWLEPSFFQPSVARGRSSAAAGMLSRDNVITIIIIFQVLVTWAAAAPRPAQEPCCRPLRNATAGQHTAPTYFAELSLAVSRRTLQASKGGHGKILQ